jgi:hypothetical protein
MFKLIAIFLTVITSLFTTLLSSKSLAASPIADSQCLLMHIVLNASAGYYDEHGDLTGIHYDFLNVIGHFRTSLTSPIFI